MQCMAPLWSRFFQIEEGDKQKLFTGDQLQIVKPTICDSPRRDSKPLSSSATFIAKERNMIILRNSYLSVLFILLSCTAPHPTVNSKGSSTEKILLLLLLDTTLYPSKPHLHSINVQYIPGASGT